MGWPADYTGPNVSRWPRQVDTVTIPGALGALDTLSVDVAGGGPFTVAGPSSVAAARTSLINQINAAALGVSAVADPNNAPAQVQMGWVYAEQKQ